ncbi:MAG: c-type cytochrome [bacterium]
MFRAGLYAGLVLASSLTVAAPNGHLLYEEHCSGCHRYMGEGGIGLPLNGSKMRRLTDDYLIKTIRYGRPGRVMPSFQYLSDAQVDAIVAHIRDWSGPSEVSNDDVRIAGDKTAGEPLFKKHCALCHGEDGKGVGQGTGVTMSRERSFLVMPPAISNPGFLVAASDNIIKETIVHGRTRTAMPAFGQLLSDQQINDIVAYVRGFENGEPVKRESMGIFPTYIIESPYEFDETVNNINQALTGSNFRLFPQRVLEEGLTDEFSHNIKQVSVRFCNFKRLYRLINTEPRLGVALPCRITVIEREGKVLLVAPNLLLLSDLFNNDELRAQAEIMDEMVRDILDEATL